MYASNVTKKISLCVILCSMANRHPEGSFRSGKTGKVWENQKTFSSH